jgi:hypothetical protein
MDEVLAAIWLGLHKEEFQLQRLIEQVRQHDDAANEFKAKQEHEREIAEDIIKKALLENYQGSSTMSSSEHDAFYVISRKCREDFDNMRTRLKQEMRDAELEDVLKRAKKGFVAFAKSVRRSKRVEVANRGREKMFVTPKGLGLAMNVMSHQMTEWEVDTAMGMADDVVAGLRALKMPNEADTLEKFTALWRELGLVGVDEMKIEFPFDEAKEIINLEGHITRITSVFLESYGYPKYVAVAGEERQANDTMETVCIYELLKERLNVEEQRLREQLRSAKAGRDEIMERIMGLVGPYMLAQEL